MTLNRLFSTLLVLLLCASAYAAAPNEVIPDFEEDSIPVLNDMLRGVIEDIEDNNTNADINGGTMDDVQIGGTTATGEIIVNDASDDADGLGDQGTAGEFLESAGTGANPTWSDTFGTWASGTFNSSTQASANSFITGYYVASSGAGNLTVKTDSASTPTTIRHQANINEGAAPTTLGFCVPVKKGDYYLVQITGSLAGAGTVFIIPIG